MPQKQPAKSRFAEEKWYGELIDLVVESFEMLRGRDYSRAGYIAICNQMKKGQKAFKEDNEEQAIFVDAVVQKMKKSKEYYHCARCDSFFLQPRQAFHHLMQLEHVDDLEFTCPPLDKMTKAVVNLVNYTVLMWFMEESGQGRIEDTKYSKLPINSSAMKPRNDFIDQLIRKYLGGCAGGRGFTSKTQFFDAQIAKLKNGVDVQIDVALREYIGQSQTFCDICKTVTGTAAEYFAHLRRFDHVMKMKLMHLPTIVANRLANRK
ncbi:hypothetical protein PMAYCL1PPCAC_01203 [Pristionchus mayeri]|uniref:C2H2-type domain-containing protein n=1 Tax=Pristionchus mayeri TaxID=1317129 RepID=A0AAN5BZF9_9BILA|nr:hypothetical protein PMAYCL1PPCAC_01203 [Pristionchus mayeri]